jgi:hypothetical protein
VILDREKNIKYNTLITLTKGHSVKERVENLLNEAQKGGTLISRWEEGFLESILRQLERGRKLSTKQLECVHKAEAKVEKMKKGEPEWEAQWDDDKATAWKIAVNYYRASPERYFSQIIDWAKSNPSKIPPQHYYKKIVENKYAQKIIKGLTTEPKYPAGSVVMLRSDARRALSYYTYQDHKGKMLFVVAPTNKAISAAKGCRIYSLLSSESAVTFDVEERFIKKYRKPKQTKNYNDVPF